MFCHGGKIKKSSPCAGYERVWDVAEGYVRVNEKKKLLENEKGKGRKNAHQGRSLRGPLSAKARQDERHLDEVDEALQLEETA